MRHSNEQSLKDIIGQFLEKDKLDDCRKLLSGYNLSLSNIDTLLKIDKTKTDIETLQDAKDNIQVTELPVDQAKQNILNKIFQS